MFDVFIRVVSYFWTTQIFIEQFFIAVILESVTEPEPHANEMLVTQR